MATKMRTGTFLAPGASRNKRKYTTENIGRAVSRMQAKLSGGTSIPMHTSHLANSEGDSRAIAAQVVKVWQDVDGKGKFGYRMVNTEAGKDMSVLTTGDTPAVKTVSIFGNWVGDKHDEDGLETADDLDVDAIDFTYRPGVTAAQLDAEMAAEAARSGAIWESFDEAFDTGEISEGDLDAPRETTVSWLAMFEAEQRHHFEDGYCRTCEAAGVYILEASKTPYGDVAYADPGYQDDKKKRYPIDTAAHVRAAWAYINKATNAKKYTTAQVSALKTKIKRAAKKFDIDITAESALLSTTLETIGSEFLDAFEAYASTSLDNGQGSVYVSAYTDEPAKLPQIGAAVARAALAGLMNLDPDNDGDVDTGSSEDDDDMKSTCPSCGFDGVPAEAMFCPSCGQPVPGAESGPGSTTKEGTEVPDKTYTAAQVKALLSEETAKDLDPKKVSYDAKELAALLAPPVVETAPAKDAITLLAEALLAGKTAPVEEDELTKARRLVAEADAKEANEPVTGAKLAEILAENNKSLLESMKASTIETARREGGIQRRGLVAKAEGLAETFAGEDAPETDEVKLSKMDSNELGQTLLAVYDPMLSQTA